MELIYEEGGDFLHEPDEWLPATLTDLQPDEGNFGPSIRWVFILDEDVQNGQARETWAWSDQKVTTKNKTGRWIRAINPGVFPDIGQAVDLGPLKGARVDIMFERKPKNDGSDGEKVVKVRAGKTPAPDPDADQTPFTEEDKAPVSAVTGKAQSASDLFE